MGIWGNPNGGWGRKQLGKCVVGLSETRFRQPNCRSWLLRVSHGLRLGQDTHLSQNHGFGAGEDIEEGVSGEASKVVVAAEAGAGGGG